MVFLFIMHVTCFHYHYYFILLCMQRNPREIAERLRMIGDTVDKERMEGFVNKLLESITSNDHSIVSIVEEVYV